MPLITSARLLNLALLTPAIEAGSWAVAVDAFLIAAVQLAMGAPRVIVAQRAGDEFLVSVVGFV